MVVSIPKGELDKLKAVAKAARQLCDSVRWLEDPEGPGIFDPGWPVVDLEALDKLRGALARLDSCKEAGK